MKHKLTYAFAALVIFLICFASSVRLRDYLYEQKLRTDIHKIKVGMTEAEVVEILGKPDISQMSDDGTYYWCYSAGSIDATLDGQQNYCGHSLLSMGSSGTVTKVYGFEH
jgi:outer membrane protein assembly factor BamE (lipoprotein component of BamABCDE complex)